MKGKTGAERRVRCFGVATVAVAAAFAASGCAQDWPVVPEADVHRAVDCRSEPSSLPHSEEGAGADWSIPAPGRVPAGFDASAALRCSLDLKLAQVPAPEDRAGGDVAWRIERFEGDLGPLLDALAAPDDVASEELVCAAFAEIVPALWLESSTGDLVPVHYPRTGCGTTKPAVHDALSKLSVTQVERVTSG